MKLENILTRKDIPEDVKEAIRVGINSTIKESNSQKIELEMQNEELRKARQYLDIAGVIVLVINADQTVALINKKGSEILGYEISEITGKNWFDTFIHEKNRARLKSIFNELIAGTIEPFKYVEDSVLTKSGEERMIFWHNTVLIDNSGKIIAILSSGEDITERRKAEDSLRQSEEKYRTLFETMAQGVVYQNAEGYIISANPAAERILGLTFDQMQGKTSVDPMWRAIHGDGTPFTGETHPSMMALKTGKEVRNVIMGVFHQKDNEYCWININAVPQFKHGEDKPFQVYTTFEDITKHKKAESVLQENESLLRGLFNNMTSGAAIYKVINDGSKGSDYIIKDFNATSLRIEGKRKDEVIGKSLLDLRPNIDQYGLIPIFQKVWRTGEPEYFPSTIYVDEKYSNWYENWVFKLPTSEIVAIYNDVTERKQAEDSLMALKDYLNNIINAIGDPLFVKDGNSRFVLANNALCDMLGIELENIIGKTLAESLPEDQMEHFLKVDKMVLESGVENLCEEPLTGRNGENLTIITKKTRYINEKGDKFLVGVIHDITKRKQSEDALHVSLAKYKILFDFFPVGITVSDKAGKIVETNQIAEKLLGITKEEHIQREIDNPVWKTVRPDGTSMPAEEYASVRALKENRLIENQEAGIVKTQGEITWINVTAAPLNLPEYGLVIIYSDITERKRKEKEIRKLHLAVEQSPSMVMITDREGNIEYVNLKFSGVSGYKQEEVMGKNPRFLKSGETSPEEYSRMWEIITSGGEWRGVFHNKKKNGELYWESAVISPIRDEKDTVIHFLALAEDITGQKKMEELLVQSEKMAAIGILAAGVAHEINNPMAYILCNLQSMEKYNQKLMDFYTAFQSSLADYSDEKLIITEDFFIRLTKLNQISNINYILSDMKDAISESIEGSERVKKIVQHLREFARVDKHTIKQVNINEAIENILVLIGSELKNKAEVIKEYGDIPEIKFDIIQLNQVFVNVLMNAADAIKERGIIKITTEHNTEWIMVRIADNGSGIPQVNLSKIFDPFYTTKAPGRGTGLGLSIAYRIMKDHKGTIDVDSIVGKGTTFTIKLPVVSE